MNVQFGKEVGWRTAHSFIRASIMFTMTLVLVMVLVAVVMLVWGLIGVFFGGGLDLSGLRTTVGIWSSVTLAALGISVPFALYNGIGQGLWAALTIDDLEPQVAERVFTGRALTLNFLGLPLLAMLFVWGIYGDSYSLFAAGIVGLMTAIPVGMVAYTAVPDLASWYRKSPYALKRKRKTQE